MKIINLDFNRIISSKEILEINEDKQKRITKYTNIINAKHNQRINHKQLVITFKLYKTYNTALKKRVNKYEQTDNKNESVYYLMNAQNEYIRDLTKKERELIACNFLITNEETFLNVLTSAIMVSNYKDINELHTEINYLCELRDNDPKKFKFFLPRLKLEERLQPIIEAFIKYYNISDINIILNKLNELYAKEQKINSKQMVKNENN